MILKSFIIEKDVKILKKYNFVLFYGENDGLKQDFKEIVKEENKGAECVNFFEDELLKNNDLLFNEIKNTSLFNSKKIIFLNEITDKTFKIINPLINENEINIYIFSKVLDKKSKLRNVFEKEKLTAVVPCYQDNERTLYNYVTINLRDFKSLNSNIINLIIKKSNFERLNIKSNINKIRSFFIDKIINENELNLLINVKYNTSFENLRDASLNGEKKITNELLEKIDFLPETNFYFINQINQRLNNLLSIQKSNSTIKNIETAMDQQKPKIFWKERPAYLKQLSKWDVINLQKTLNETYNLEVKMKSNSLIKHDVLLKNFIVSLCSNNFISA